MSVRSEVYTWRLSPEMKATLEEAARNANVSVARLLEQIVARQVSATHGAERTERERQRRLHSRAEGFAGSLSGTDPDRAATARTRVRARLAQRHRRVD